MRHIVTTSICFLLVLSACAPKDPLLKELRTCQPPPALRGDSLALAAQIELVADSIAAGGQLTRGALAEATLRPIIADQAVYYRCTAQVLQPQAVSPILRLQTESIKAVGNIRKIMDNSALSSSQRKDSLDTIMQQHLDSLSRASQGTVLPRVRHKNKIWNTAFPQNNLLARTTISGSLSLLRRATGDATYTQFLTQNVPGNALYALQTMRNDVLGYVRGGITSEPMLVSTVGSVYLIGDQLIQ